MRLAENVIKYISMRMWNVLITTSDMNITKNNLFILEYFSSKIWFNYVYMNANFLFEIKMIFFSEISTKIEISQRERDNFVWRRPLFFIEIFQFLKRISEKIHLYHKSIYFFPVCMSNLSQYTHFVARYVMHSQMRSIAIQHLHLVLCREQNKWFGMLAMRPNYQMIVFKWINFRCEYYRCGNRLYEMPVSQIVIIDQWSYIIEWWIHKWFSRRIETFKWKFNLKSLWFLENWIMLGFERTLLAKSPEMRQKIWSCSVVSTLFTQVLKIFCNEHLNTFSNLWPMLIKMNYHIYNHFNWNFLLTQ